MTTPTNRNTRHIINASTAMATPSSGISSGSANDHEYGRFSTPITPNSSWKDFHCLYLYNDLIQPTIIQNILNIKGE